MVLKYLIINPRKIGSPYLLFVVLIASLLEGAAHDWHRPHDGSGAPVNSSPFAVPESSGEGPDNEAVVAELAEAFTHFFPEVRVNWDENWLYVESNGMPNHGLMKGITNWQQQVGLPQNYYGTNAWQIPLDPQLSDNPLSTNDNFFRGAIALAVNGVPIFNALNNRGEDAYLIGELDDWGGHAGRADDYHYHAAPLHLIKVVGESSPIAYALDGFPIYGLNEPDGSPAVGLDEFNGHFGPEYHYHSSLTFPYINGGLRGVVTISGGQIEPQPSTKGVRPATTPLKGAEIMDYEFTEESQHSLIYTLNNQSYKMIWSTNEDKGTASFTFINPNGSASQDVYSNWVSPPQIAEPILDIRPDEGGLLRFDFTGEPGIAYPFASSQNLSNWERFGFIQLDHTGLKSFYLRGSKDSGFLRMMGRLDH